MELTNAEMKKQLEKYQRVLAENGDAFVKAGGVLQRIRDEELFRAAGYETFDEYCRLRWGFPSEFLDFMPRRNNQ